MINNPFVTCIMPTYNRRRFVPGAIRCFLQQDYPERELIILDDGTDSIADLVPDDSRIRYIRLEGKLTTGAKRNRACRESKGGIIAHWDDDDWSAPHRLSYQVRQLREQQADICGLDRLFFHNPDKQDAWEYVYPKSGKPWLAGGTMCYKKSFWQRNPFPEINIGEDGLFVWSNVPRKLVTLPDNTFYLATIHPNNTSPKSVHDRFWHPVSPQKIQDIRATEADLNPPLPTPCFSSPLERGTRGTRGGWSFHGGSAVTPPEISPSQPQKKTARYEKSSTPKVSCILPTCNRPAFFRQVVRCFLRQTFDDSELIVVDDGEISVQHLADGLLRVRYIRLDKRTSLGEKLNIGIREAKGRIIQKWDDDDFYHPHFLERAVSRLESANPGRNLVAWGSFMVLLLDQLRVCPSGNGWAAGGTLCFHKSLWEEKPFRHIPKEVDTHFIRDANPKIIRVNVPELYMLVRHGTNTWNNTGNIDVDDFFRKQAPYSKTLEQLVEPLDMEFYKSISDASKQTNTVGHNT